MKVAIFCLIIPAIFANPLSINGIKGRIIGGSNIDISQAPYQVFLRSNWTSRCYTLCAGSIISKKYVVTAAHCERKSIAPPVQCILPIGVISTIVSALGLSKQLSSVVPASDITIIGGSSTHSPSDGITYTAAEVIEHPQYSPDTNGYDATLIKINEEFFSNWVIAVANSVVLDGTVLQIIGWGDTTGNGTLSANLKKGTVKKISNDACQNMYGSTITITSQMLCAGNTTSSTCQGIHLK